MICLIISGGKFLFDHYHIEHRINLTTGHREAGSVILKITYGYTAKSHGPDPFVDLAGATMKGFAEAVIPGKWMVDIFPFCKFAQT